MLASEVMLRCAPIQYCQGQITLPESDLDVIPVLDAENKYIGVVPGFFARNRKLKYWQDIINYLEPPLPCVREDDDVANLTAPAVVVNGYNQITGVITIWQLMEMLKVRNQALQERSDAFERFVNSFGNGISVTDQEGNIVHINQMYAQLTNLKETDISGKNILTLIQKKYFDQSVTLSVLENQRSVTMNQYINGKKFIVTGYPFWDKDKKIEKVINIIDPVDEPEYVETGHTVEITAQMSLVYVSKSMDKLVRMLKKVAVYDSNILITGESGTGKEVFARSIHEFSKRKKKPFIAINCSAIPDNLLESEIFGYERGAFSGANREGKAGLLELADGGTFFFDEIGEMPLNLQAKLLRFLETRKIRRIGGKEWIDVDCRVVAATNQNLEKMVNESLFREDLFYRLFVIPLQIPPLRDRKEDIPELLAYYLTYYNKKFGSTKVIDQQVVEVLKEYPWKGNIRELKNLVERMIILSEVDKITLKDIPDYIYDACNAQHLRHNSAGKVIERTEEKLLRELYENLENWNDVAKELGISRATVYRKAKKYGLIEVSQSQSK